MLFTTLTSADNGLNLCTGVLINDELKAFESKFDKVNSMSTSDLRKRSIELLCNNEKLGINEPESEHHKHRIKLQQAHRIYG